MDYLHPLAARLHGHICRIAIDPRVPHSRGPLADRRHHLRDRFLHDRAGSAIRFQRNDM
jgi:hypothetical protein